MEWRRGAAVLALIVVVVPAVTAWAQQGVVRAWQRRLALSIPLPLPVIEVEAVDPLAVPVDRAPRLVASVPPRNVPVSGTARVAAYIDERGRCEGAVPLEVPFPGIATRLVEKVMGARFEPARTGKQARPSWAALEIVLAGKVKRAGVLNQALELPDPASPPTPAPKAEPYVSGRLVGLPAADPDELTTVASPRRLSVRIPGLETEAPLRLLVHVTGSGRCDRYVPLEMAPGLRNWTARFLASWQLEPAVRDGEAVPAWVIYRSRVELKLSSLSSTTVRVLPKAVFTPVAAPAGSSPSAP